MNVSPIRVVVLLCILSVTWLILESTTTVEPVEIKKSLAEFPKKIGDYELTDSFQSSTGVLELLGVDDYIQYNYVSASGDYINLYVGYYRAVGVEGAYHSPKNCIPGGGWGIDSVDEVTLKQGVEGDSESTISKMIIRMGPEYQLVYYWFQNRGRIIASEYWEKIYLVLDAIFKGRRDGTFVRIISYVPEGKFDVVEEKVQNFAELVLVELENHLPGEVL